MNDRQSLEQHPLLVGAPLVQKPSPDSVVQLIAADIKPSDRVVFLKSYFHSSAYQLNVQRPVPIVGVWKGPARQLPDTQYRELIEGAEAAGPALNEILIDASGLERILARPGVTWVVGETTALGDFAVLNGQPVAAQDKRYSVVRVERQP